MSGSAFTSRAAVLHRLDPRTKLVGLMILAFSYSYISNLLLLGVMGIATILLWTVSGLSASFVLKKLKFPSLIILALVATLPFISGETILMDLRVVTLKQEGLVSSIIIGTRFLCIISTALIVFNSTPVLDCIKAMRAMSIPWILADMIFLVFRYLQVIGDDYKRMRASMQLRGFDGNRFSFQTLRTIAWLSGGLLVRSFERSDWIYRSMRTRGYGNRNVYKHDFQAGRIDLISLAGVILLASGLVTFQLLMGN